MLFRVRHSVGEPGAYVLLSLPFLSLQAVQAFNAALKSGDMNLQALGIESDRGAAGMAGSRIVGLPKHTLSWRLAFVSRVFRSVA